MGEARQLAERHIAGFNERRWDTSLYAPDIEIVEPGGTLRGVDAFKAMGEGFVAMFPDSAMHVQNVIESGDAVAVEGAYRGTHTSGRTLDLPICLVFRVEAGRIASNHAYYDQAAFAAQIG
jgi:ketosteroid isomerase-like protein